MIFDSNTTSLGTSIPMAEGYDSSYGAAKALVESARNDYKMFKALLSVDAREMNIMNESSGYVLEGELYALAEAAGTGLLEKLKGMFKKLAAKIKAIFNTFMSKLNVLFKSDKQMVNKYEKELLRKSYLGKMKVKWRKTKGTTPDLKAKTLANLGDEIDAKHHSDDADEMHLNVIKAVAGDFITDQSDFQKEFVDHYLDDEEEMQLQETDSKSIRDVMKYIVDNSKTEKELKKHRDKIDKEIGNYLKEIDRYITQSNTDLGKATEINDFKSIRTVKYKDTDNHLDYNDFGDVEKDSKGANITDDAKKTERAKQLASANIETNKKIYEVGTAVQTAYTMYANAIIEIEKIKYKQNKAAFMKAIAASDEKLKNESTYLDAVYEAAEEEVEDVIAGALSSKGDEMLASTSNAPTNVIDTGISNNDYDLSYNSDIEKKYKPASTDGSIDSGIVAKDDGKATDEAAYFGGLFY